jgi:hypothetical protein
MGRYSEIKVAAILALAIAGCNSEGSPQATNPTPTTAPTTAPTTTTKTPPATQAFTNPVVPAKPGQVVQVASATPNLIQPTNATERVVVVSKGRTDPFAQIIGQPVPTISNTTTAAKPIPVLPALPTPRTPIASTAAVRNTTTRSAVISTSTRKFTIPKLQPKIPRTSVATALPKLPNKLVLPKKGFVPAPVMPRVMPQVVSNPTLSSVLPPPAQPDMAKAVLVTGIVQVGSEPQAIIRVPNEPTSRYVRAGQRLANGLLIKRIEMNEGSNPVVIVEQYGIEVARMVGEVPSSGQQTQAATQNPVSGVTSPQNNIGAGAT